MNHFVRDIMLQLKRSIGVCILGFLIYFPASFCHAQVYDGSDIRGIEQIVAQVQQQAGWRQVADRRINQHRKSDMRIIVHDADGKPVSGATVQARLVNHAFAFGSAIGSRDFDTFKHVLPNFINKLGFENALKYKHRDGIGQNAPAIIEWAKSRVMPVRGHVLMWPGWKFMHAEAQQYKGGHDLEGLRRFCEKQITDYAKKWDVVEWDVMNESRANQDLQKLFGRAVMAEWFKLAKVNLRNKNALLYINENKIISAPPGMERNIRLYKDEIQFLLDNGAPVSAIGLQSRFRTDAITPEMMYDRLEQFSEFNMPLTATEFEIRGSFDGKWEPTDQKRAELTEWVMHTYFSHPRVDGIIAWTFMNRADQKFGLLNGDLSVPLHGKVWLHLTRQHWTTNERRQTTANGSVNIRGFQGEYEVTVTAGERRSIRTLHLAKTPAKLVVALER
jgi:endo-1,4-beta-xylanase